MKVIIAGSRDLTSPVLLREALSRCNFDIKEVVSGNARGVDRLGEYWAQSNNIPLKLFPADWANLGKSAGIRRNIEMAEYADALIAIWDGRSKGTLHMICGMVAKNKPVYVYCP